MTKDERSEAEISATAIELAGELLKFCGERAEHHPWVIQRALMLVLSKRRRSKRRQTTRTPWR